VATEAAGADSPRAQLRTLLAGDELVLAPGCHDALSAKQVEDAGFKATYINLYAINACLFGQPNIGYATLTEVANHIRYITAAITIPLIVDAGIGFGDAISTQRAVRELEWAGAAGIHLEDQLRPWSPTTGIECPLVSTADFSLKLEAAIDARVDPNFMIMVWTFATYKSLDETLGRSKAYCDAGADLIIPSMSPFMRHSGRAGAKTRALSMLNATSMQLPKPIGTHSPFGIDFTPAEVSDAGAKLYMLTLPTLGPAVAAVQLALAELAQGEPASSTSPFEIADFSRLLGIRQYDGLASRMGFTKRRFEDIDD
jgi:2-methylisocitrate lyase-like PEP mutase family enzyme